MDIAILILAAGSSSRMNSPKQLLEIGDKTLLSLVIEKAKHSKAQNIYCVLGAYSEKIKTTINEDEIEIIYNQEHYKGLSSSIRKGISHIKHKNYDATLVILADQPNVSTDHLNLLIDTLNNNTKTIIASKYSNGLGVPAIFPNCTYNELLKLRGDKGAKEYLNSNETKVLGITYSSLIDIDTQSDYEDYLKSL